jgi:hypothetical protein
MRASASSVLLGGVLAAAGCTGSDLEGYPLAAGTGGTPGPHAPGASVRGRVCVAIDLRDFGTCASGGAGGLVVALGGAAAITAADGAFELPTPIAGGTVDLLVTGPGVIPTFNPFDPSRTPVVTAIDADVFARELSSTGVLLPDGTGSILGRVVIAASPASGIAVTSVPAAPFGPFYDGLDAFTLDRTGARGVFFVPGLVTGAANLTFRDVATASETLVSGVMVRNGGITILDSVPLP